MNEKLLAIQKEIGAIKKDSVNPHFKNSYFDINTLLSTVKPVLNKYKVVLIQGLVSDEKHPLALETKLIDTEDGTELNYTCRIPEGASPQQTGSAITYFRRYALTALLALEAEDDDANHASATKQATTSRPTAFKAKPTDDSIPF